MIQYEAMTWYVQQPFNNTHSHSNKKFLQLTAQIMGDVDNVH